MIATVSIDQFVASSDLLPDPLMLLTADGEILAVNNAFGKCLLLPKAAFIGKRIGDLIADPFGRAHPYLLACSKINHPLPGALTFIRADGERITFRADGAVLLPRSEGAPAIVQLRCVPREKAGEQFALMSSRIKQLTQEISARRQAEMHAEEQRAWLQVTLSSIGDAVIATDKKGQIAFMNPVAEELTGWRQSEALGRDCTEVFQITNEATGLAVESPVVQVLREGVVVVGLANHTILTAKNGITRPIDDSGAPIKDQDGKLQGVVLVFRDITERKEAERLLRAVLDNTPATIYVKDLMGRYTLVNQAFETLNGRSFADTIGRTDEELFPPELCGRILENDRIVRETGQPHQFEELGEFQGQSFTYLSTKFPLRDLSGEIYAVCGVSTDITHRKRQEAARLFLTEASAIFASSLDYEQTLQKVADLAVPHIADWCAVDMLDNEDNINLLAVAHIDPEKVKWAYELRKSYPPDRTEPQGLANVLKTGKAEIYAAIPEELLVASARDEQHLTVLRQIGFRSVLIVPIIARSHTLGAITFVTTKESGRNYTEEDLNLAEGLAARAALAIDNARLYQEAQSELRERRQVQGALRVSEERFRFALAHSDIAVYTTDRDLRYTWVYNGRISGEQTSLYGKRDGDFLERDDAAILTEIKQRVLKTGAEERHTVRATVPGQPESYYDTLFAPLRDGAGNIVGVTGTVNDITERKKAQDALTEHQAQIESLNVRLQRSMQETHHRVKNNLQVITALVNFQQLQYKESIPVTEMTRLMQHIRSLASIHDLLTHQAKTDAEVSEISLREIVARLHPSLQSLIQGRIISFTVPDVYLPIRLSSTFAILVNELVSNAMKHGEGNIHVSFSLQEGTARLMVTDEGPGFPEGFDSAQAANTGLELIDSLSHVDLGGEVRYENRAEGGGRVNITFPLPFLTKNFEKGL